MPSKHVREEGLGDDEEGAVPPQVFRAKSSRDDDNDDDEEGEDGHAAAAAAVGQFDSWLSERHAVLEALQRDVDDPPWMLPPAHGVEMTTGASRPPRSTFKFDGRKWKVNEQREENVPSHLFWRDNLPWVCVNEDRYGQSVSQSMRSSRLNTSATNDLFCCAPITRLLSTGRNAVPRIHDLCVRLRSATLYAEAMHICSQVWFHVRQPLA
jgi:hypothetical protein